MENARVRDVAVERCTRGQEGCRSEEMGPDVHGFHVKTSPETPRATVRMGWHRVASQDVFVVAQPGGDLVFVRDQGPIERWVFESVAGVVSAKDGGCSGIKPCG